MNFKELYFESIEDVLKGRGLKGDALLNNLDLIDELKDNGAVIDSSGNVTLYHRTSKENAESIRKTGKMTAEEDGIFFSTSEEGQAKGYGPEVIRFKIPVEKIVLDDVFGDEAHVRYPIDRPHQEVDIKKFMEQKIDYGKPGKFDQKDFFDTKKKDKKSHLTYDPTF